MNGKKRRQCFKHRHNIIVYMCSLLCKKMNRSIGKRLLILWSSGSFSPQNRFHLLASASVAPHTLVPPHHLHVALSVDIQYYNAIMIALYLSFLNHFIRFMVNLSVSIDQISRVSTLDCVIILPFFSTRFFPLPLRSPARLHLFPSPHIIFRYQ